MNYIALSLEEAITHLQKPFEASLAVALQVSGGYAIEKRLPAQLPKLSQALATNTWLKQLDFTFMPLGDENFNTLMQGLSKNTTVEDILFKCCGITDEGMASLCHVLTCKTTTIKRIDLQGNAITDKGIAALAQAIRTQKRPLQLNIADNPLTEEGAKEIASLLAENLVFSVTIKWQAGWTFFKARAASFAQQLKQNHTLTRVSLANNQLTGDELKQLVYTLCENRVLKEFDVSQNAIDDSGITAFSRVLVVNTVLDVLDLRHNLIGESGAKALANALVFNRGLSTLRLQNNAITTEGALALFHAVQQRGIPLKLELQGNPIDDTLLPHVKVDNQHAFFQLCQSGKIPHEKRPRIRSNLNQTTESLLLPGMTLNGATWLVYVWSLKPPSIWDTIIASFWQQNSPSTTLIIEGRDENHAVFIKKYTLVKAKESEVFALHTEEYPHDNYEHLKNTLNDGFYIACASPFSKVNAMLRGLHEKTPRAFSHDWATKALKAYHLLDRVPDFCPFHYGCCLDESIIAPKR